MSYKVYRLSHEHPTDGYKKIFFKKDLNDIYEFLKKELQVHLYKIEGLNDDAEYVEIDISDKIYKRNFYATDDLVFRFNDDDSSVEDFVKTINKNIDFSYILLLIKSTYSRKTFESLDESSLKNTKRFFNIENKQGLVDFGKNPYLTLFRNNA